MLIQSQFLSRALPRSLFLAFCVLLLPGFEIALGADEPTAAANQYFGHIEAPCITTEKCEEFTDLVKRASSGDECNKIDEECKVGDAILRKIFGSTYRQTLPDFIIYLDDSAKPGTKEDTAKIFTLKEHTPLLMWQGKNTPHLMGVRAIYVVALAHNPLELHATVTSDSQYEPNPLIGLIGTSFKAPEAKGAAADPTKSTDGKFIWRPLNGNADKPESGGTKNVTWVGTAHIVVPENTINRITVSYGPLSQDENAKDAADAAKITDAAVKFADAAAEVAHAAVGKNKEKNKEKADEQADKKDARYSGDFLAATGHFTNSPESYAAVSFALGTTFNSKNTSIAAGGSNVNIDGFAFAKFYLSRPYLYATPRATRYHPSYGLVIGTNVNGTIFNNIVVGISVGHIVGDMGIIAGVNSIAGTANTNQGRKNRAFLGLEYTF